MILIPGNTFTVVCDDGMSSGNISILGRLFNFGANIRFENCGAATDLDILNKAKVDMHHKLSNFSHKLKL